MIGSYAIGRLPTTEQQKNRPLQAQETAPEGPYPQHRRTRKAIAAQTTTSAPKGATEAIDKFDLLNRLTAENDRLRFENRNLIADLGTCRSGREAFQKESGYDRS